MEAKSVKSSWAGVPIYLRTGKRLAARASEIAVVFKETPHSIFGIDSGRHRNVLSIRLQPNEGMTLGVTIKEPGPGGLRVTHRQDLGLEKVRKNLPCGLVLQARKKLAQEPE